MSAKPSGIVKVCPICNGKTKCIDTRESGEVDNAIRRRYKCINCDYRYSTIEVSLEDYKRNEGAYAKYKKWRELLMEALE